MTRRLILALGLGASLTVLLAAAPPAEFGRQGMVAADHELASRAGAQILAKGGNAIDAVVATALACGVVQPAGSGLGGGGFAVVVEPGTAEPAVLDFREMAPAAAHRDMYIEATVENASRDGGLAVAVPAEGPGLAALHARYGRLSPRQVAQPAVQLAKKGFAVGYQLGKALAANPDRSARLSPLLFGTSRVPQRGDTVRRAKLARTIEGWAATGGRNLVTGAAARDIVATVQDQGGVLTMADLAAYEPKSRAPLVGSYRGWTVVTMPPPSSGGLVLLQVLSVLEGYDLAGTLPHGSADYLHMVTEAMKHAYADRARFMGDPDRVDIPVERLLSADRVEAVRRAIVPGRTFGPAHYGAAVDPGTDAGTQHISVIDADGLSVALTTTINTSFGSKVLAAESGVLLNNEMDDFVARPGEPNAFGLMGSEANAVAPGARPLSSMSPTVLISPDGSQRISVGGSGGPFIISGTLQAILAAVDYGMDPSEAVSTGRVHHQWTPDLLFVDPDMADDVRRSLSARGHTLKDRPFAPSVQMVQQTQAGFYGASDPRKGGRAAGI